MQLTDKLAKIQERIHAAAQRAGRPTAEITLVAVSKTHSAATILDALAAGATNFGENRIQEASGKIAELAEQRAAMHWHLIGHLQRNKAKVASELFDLVHSVDSLKLAEALDRHVGEQGVRPRLPILLQVNVSGEASKEGFDLAGGLENQQAFSLLQQDIAQIVALPHLELRGLMTIAPFSDFPEESRPVFKRLRLLRDLLAQQFPTASWGELSMGMSDDFPVAIEEGATIVRIGRALFGER